MRQHERRTYDRLARQLVTEDRFSRLMIGPNATMPVHPINQDTRNELRKRGFVAAKSKVPA